MEELAVHEAAQIFPLMPKSELDNLSADIKENGLKEPIVLYKGKILDGRNRYSACQVAEVEPSFRDVDLNGFEPYEYVVKHNLEARHLSIPQRAAIAVEIFPILAEQSKKRRAWLLTQGNEPEDLPKELGRYGSSIKHAADLLGVGQSTVDRARLLCQKRPDLLSRMKAGEFKTVNQARRAAGETWRGQAVQREGKVVMYGRGDRWQEAIKPIRLYLSGWARRGFEFRHVNPKEARKRLKEIAVIEEQLAIVRSDLEARAVKATTHFDSRDHLTPKKGSN